MNGSATAVASPAAAGRASVAAAPAVAKDRGAGPERFWLEAVVVRVARLVGSLQLAVFLLAWFAAVLAVGTVVESWYNGKVAQELVYRTWWFKLLMFLLGANIFFAAAKKWPWKKYQTGFLITHVGLLLLVASGVVTSFSGTDAQMTLVDTAQVNLQEDAGVPQKSSRAVLSDATRLRVRKVSAVKGGADQNPAVDYPFNPGSLPWPDGAYMGNQLHPLLKVLDFVDHPLPRSWEEDLGDGTVLKVLKYYPHARQENYSPAPAGADGVPAVKVALKSGALGRAFPQEPWLVLTPRAQLKAMGPGLLEMLGRCPGPLADEFLHPPAAQAVGSMGQLVLVLDGVKHRFKVDEVLGKSVDAGTSRVRVIKYTPDLNDPKSDVPAYPLIEFEVTGADGKATDYWTLARFAGVAIPMKDGQPARRRDALQVWYHPPDYRYGRGEDTRAVLQFAVGDGGGLYYRSFNSHGPAGFAFEGAGEAKAGAGAYPIWKGMNWEFQVREFLPEAVARVRYVPEATRPGLESPQLVAAVRCQLVRGKDKSEEFWVGKGGDDVEATLGSTTYEVGYHTLSRALDFEIKLLRAEQTVDPGTQHSATYTSYVQLTDAGAFSAEWVPGPLRGLTNFLGLTSGGTPIEAEDRYITMNEPLDHRGFKIYQSNFGTLPEWDDRQRPVSYSGFTVGRDPGLPLKYLGSTMLALGIACMFYMKAYFFKPRGRAA